MDKRATDKILSIYWFAILIIVAGGVFVIINMFYNSPYDVREVEANLLINKVADCLSTQGEISNLKVLDAGGNFLLNRDNFLEICHLNFKVEDEFEWRSSPQYYLGLTIFKVSDVNNPVLDIEVGNTNYKADCQIQDDKEYEKLVKCVDRGLYASGQGEQYLIKISSIVRKSEKNVK